MFDSLGDKLEGVFKKLRGHDKLTEANMKDALRDVRLALLEADVNYKVVKDFVTAVQTKAEGQKVISGVNPAQMFVKIVHDELVTMMKGTVEDRPFEITPGRLNVILMLGLQGAGKTTFCGKLAHYLETRKNAKPILAACDVYRPAAIEQLKTVGHSLGIPVFARDTQTPVNEIVRGAVTQANASGRNVLIVDTAGRLHIDEVKMDELIALRDEFKPDYTFLVADAMTGQDAVNSATAFNEQVGIDGVCLTKMDGDARGGAALSIKSVTGKPIVFIGTGEKAENLEQFHPDRVANRILGMGDVVSLVEKAQEVIDEKDVMDMQEKFSTGTFSYDDFIKQMRMIKRMGPLKGLLGMLPGVGQMMKGIDSDVLDKQLKHVETIIQSMTAAERANGDLVARDGRRRERIAKGSGHSLKEINDLVRQFDQMKGMMQMMSGGGMMGGLGGLLGGGGGMPRMPGGGGMPGRMPPGMAPPGMSKRMQRMQKEMQRREQAERLAAMPRKKKDRKKKR
ncbi:MAG TPA: signal recognition particle protein [Candidatus Sumerlaeota bacterium]|nr:signal recognition particle protein [Candidatus Sumerlaeota bacterium]